MTERLSDKCPCDKCGKDKRCELSQEACEDYLKWEDDCIKKLAEYETAEDEGRLVVLSCDTVYFVYVNKNGRAHVRAKSILDLYLHEILGIDRDGRYWSDREEAEKALKEMEKDDAAN